MNIILFGPPGVGKSTLIGVLKSKGVGAIDLEDFYPNRIRYQIPNLVDDKFIAAADLNPKRSYSNALKVLLTARQDAYDRRRAARDAKDPGKASQSQHLMENWTKGTKYDFLLDTTALSPEQTVSKLLEFKKGRNK